VTYFAVSFRLSRDWQALTNMTELSPELSSTYSEIHLLLMMFVSAAYTMMRRAPAGIEEGVPPPELVKCKKYACSLQHCLAKRNHKIEQCQGHFDAWENCAAIVRDNITAEQARGKDNVKGFD
jgi:hypothetical protein